MGVFMSRIQLPLGRAADRVSNIITRRKRKREDNDDTSSEELSSILDKSLRSPKKKKLMTTTQYIYQALFKEEKSSDITVRAAGKLWRLHKVYLGQSPYFASMFGGSWRESDQDFINIEIIDPKITVDSLYIVFGSLYLDEITLEPIDIISTLATAALFQLEGLMERCAEVMVESVNAETAVSYYEAACQYGIQSVKKASFDWLLVNLLSFYTKHFKWLRPISVELMYDLVSSPDLFVMQTEFSIYILLRFWLFFKIHPNYNTEHKDSKQINPIKYFADRKDKIPFLKSRQGRQFEKPFKAIRFHHLLSHHKDIQILLEDRIIPESWFHGPLLHQWDSMLCIDESIDKGPTECDESLFYSTCLRCGRTLQEEGFQKWRWTGFNFGLDLVLITDTRTLTIKRHHRAENERLLSLQVKRNFLIRVTVASLNELRQVKHKQTTDIKALSLNKNDEISLLYMDKELIYPLLISVNLMVISPRKTLQVINNSKTKEVQNSANTDLDKNSENQENLLRRNTSESPIS